MEHPFSYIPEHSCLITQGACIHQECTELGGSSMKQAEMQGENKLSILPDVDFLCNETLATAVMQD